MSHSKCVGQYILNDPYEVVHFVSPSAYRVAFAVRCAIQLVRTARCSKVYQYKHYAKSLLGGCIATVLRHVLLYLFCGGNVAHRALSFTFTILNE